MSRRFCFRNVFKAFLMALLVVAVSVQPAEAARKKKVQKKAPDKYAALVIDATSGKVIYQKNADATRHPASLTKMMTLYLTFAALEKGRLHMNDRMYVSSLAAAQSPSKLGLRTGDRLKVEDAILGLVTQSANDAAVVLAESIGGSESRFAVMMTDTARKLGMTKTVFKNANGLPNKQQVTTARDMAKLGLALLRHYPQYYPYFSTSGFSYEGNYYRNHNRLMSRYKGMDGIKTGFVNASGFNLVASAMRDGHRLVGVVFGGQSAASRDNQMEALLNDSFSKIKDMDKPQMNANAQPDKKVLAGGELPSVDEDAALPEIAATATAFAGTPAAFEAPAPARKPVTIASGAKGATVQLVDADEGGMTEAEAEGDAALDSEPAAAPPTQAEVIQAVASQPKNGWGIQIGAYNDRPSSQRALAIIADQNADLLRSAETRVLAVDTPSGTIYRARLVGVDEDTARRSCARLTKQNHSCLTLPPAGAPGAWLSTAQ